LAPTSSEKAHPLWLYCVNIANFVEYYSGLPNDPDPAGQVLVGSFTASTIVNFGMFTQYSQSGWAFSDEVGANQAALISFADLSNALGLNHSITQQTSSTTWVLWLDDAVSYLYDDDNNDVIKDAMSDKKYYVNYKVELKKSLPPIPLGRSLGSLGPMSPASLDSGLPERLDRRL